MKAKTASIEIEDISQVGHELSEDELANVAGGLRIIFVYEACSCAVGGGYDYD